MELSSKMEHFQDYIRILPECWMTEGIFQLFRSRVKLLDGSCKQIRCSGAEPGALQRFPSCYLWCVWSAVTHHRCVARARSQKHSRLRPQSKTVFRLPTIPSSAPAAVRLLHLERGPVALRTSSLSLSWEYWETLGVSRK